VVKTETVIGVAFLLAILGVISWAVAQVLPSFISSDVVRRVVSILLLIGLAVVVVYVIVSPPGVVPQRIW
jgi:hypothetical protein